MNKALAALGIITVLLVTTGCKNDPFDLFDSSDPIDSVSDQKLLEQERAREEFCAHQPAYHPACID